jgi:hypothetical protein
MNSPRFDQYLQLSPEERALQDRLYFEELMNPQRLAFLAALLKMSMSVRMESSAKASSQFARNKLSARRGFSRCDLD